MKKVTLLIVTWLTLFVVPSKAADQGCTYYQNLLTNTTYYVHNPEYPNNYAGAHSCQWTMKSDYRIKVSCELELPNSYNCQRDHLDVHVSQATGHRYCGKTNFVHESEGNELIINLKSYYWSYGGRFTCEVNAIERPGSQQCRCGWKNPTRIVGGVETGVNEFPMMAGLVTVKRKEVYCGATIINLRYVLTAAHCVFKRDVADLGVLVGDHDWTIGSDTNASRLHKAERYAIHPSYNQSTTQYDAAVVKTTTQIIYNQEVGPACLPFLHSYDSFIGDFVDILGWGTGEFAGARYDALQKVTLSILANVQCSVTYPKLTYNEICTFGEKKDACQFDSGGPVLWQNPTSRQLVLIGIINYGGACGYGPGVNARVGTLLDWITSVTPDANYCMNE